MTEQIKFTQELKDQWLEALRSGKYSQTTCTLKDTDGFCCLGVLCDIINPDGWQNITPEDLEDPEYDDGWLHTHGQLVYGKSFAGIGRESNKPVPEHIYDLLPVDYSEFAKRNDGDYVEIDEEIGDANNRQFNFDEMADWIEENVPANG